MSNLNVKQIGVSIEKYTSKPNFKNVRYVTKKRINKDELIKLIQDGYSFTHAFHANGEYGNKEKTINNFKQTNFIWFDFDDCIDSIDNVSDRLTYKPNIAYTTISNLQNGNSNRFRLIYLLDFDIYSNDDYRYYLNLLLNTIINDLGKGYLKYIDNNCFNVSQQMFGSNANANIITNDNNIYTKNLFECISSNYNINDFINKGGKNFKSKEKKKEKILIQNEKITTSLSDLVDMLQSIDIRTFQPILSNEHLALLEKEDIYTNVSEQGIYMINAIYDKEGKIKKVPNGNRNNMLFNWGITIKNINPNIYIEELTKYLYWLYIYRCERSDDFSISQVCNIALSVYKTDTEDYQNLGKRKYLINPENKILSRPEKSKALGKARRKTRDNNILSDYDFSKSIKENAIVLGVSEGSIRNSFIDNDIKTPNQEKFDRFKEVYTNNPNITNKELAKLVKISEKTVRKYKSKIQNCIGV